MPLRFFKLLWPLTWPVRFYLHRSPYRAGKRRLRGMLDAIVLSVSADTFTARLPGGLSAELRFDEVLGRTYLDTGGFEVGESELLRAFAKKGTTAIDVGANVGLLTITLADAVGESGSVWAFEPLPSTAVRLRNNLWLNKLMNVDVVEKAVADSEVGALMNLADDPAYHSLGAVYEGRGTGQQVEVPTTTLDSVWRMRGAPQVSVIKVDTEGTEAAVVAGGLVLTESCRPAFVVEATSSQAVDAIVALLQPFGYTETWPRRVHRWTYVFVCTSDLRHSSGQR